MNRSYLYEIRRKSEDFEHNFERLNKRENSNLSELSKDDEIWEVPEENFENVYQQMGFNEAEEEQEEYDDDEDINLKTPPPTLFDVKPFENSSKMHLSLSCEKIALKSQQQLCENSNRTTMPQKQIINKSINTETDMKKSMTTATTNITAIATTNATTTTSGGNNKVQWKNVKTTNNNNNKSGKNKQTNNSKSVLNFTIVPIKLTQGQKKTTEGEEDITKFPEIKLSSFSTKRSSKATIPLQKFKSNNPFNTTAAAAPIQDSKITSNIPRRKSSSGSEINRHITDCSTSPESLLDNVLSAASSVSVQSSSLSSNGLMGDMELINRKNDLQIRDNLSSQMTPFNVTKNNSGVSKSQIPELKIITIPPSPSTPLNQQSPPPPTTTGAHISPSLLTISNISHSESFETATNRSRSPSASPLRSFSLRVTPEYLLYPDELRCQICKELFKDPRSLNCLHSFCFQCIVNENFNQDASIPFWSQPSQSNQQLSQISSPLQQQQQDEREWKAITSPNQSIRSASPEIPSIQSNSDISNSPSQQKRRSSFSFKRKKSSDPTTYKNKSDNSSSVVVSQQNSQSNQRQTGEMSRLIMCKICQFPTEVPVGGIRQLPQNFLLVRRIEEIRYKVGEEVITRIWCSLCFEETNATYHCITCILNLCTLCKEAHERQKTTTQHNIKNIMELRRARKKLSAQFIDNSKFTLKCCMHPGFEIKSFCTVCLQIACTDCLILLHKGHKHEPISKAINYYSRILRESVDQTRPLCNYAEHSIGKLNTIAKSINRKCDEIQAEVEEFMASYFEAVEVHKTTLLQQVHRARESKVEMILEHQLDLEKRTNEASSAVKFSQELIDVASDVEILSFVKMLLKRFEYCQQFKAPIDPKISDSLHFLPKIRAPAAKNLNDISLFGIITMQTVEPSLCTLQWDGFSQLRLHKKTELVLISRDADGVSLCHGGLQINSLIKYKDNSKPLPIEVSDNRDGSYVVAFTPDSQGTLILTITINDKPIKGSPFSFQARTVRPHNGIFHCCAFCSSKGNKLVKCYCDGRMPGYNGCGHGHAGHPGRRHWSCCGNVLQNSECNVVNKLLNT